MKKSLKRFLLIVPVIMLSVMIPNVESKSVPEKTLFRIIQQGLEAWHYSGRKVDDSFSRSGMKEYINYLDYGKRYFLKSDIEEFYRFEEKIDDSLTEGNPELMNLATSRIIRRIKNVLKVMDDLQASGFDLTIDEEIDLSTGNREFFPDENAQRDYWRRLLKYNVISRYLRLSKTKKSSPVPVNEELKKKAENEIFMNFRSRLEREIKTHSSDSVSIFINSLAQVFDPHTTYFPPKEMEDFDIEMTGKLEGIGALLGEKDGYVSIVRIIPGGPSWKQKELGAGDKILKVTQEKGDPVDVVGMRTIDAVKHIRGKKGTRVNLTVLKPDGRTVTIPIVRDVVVIEETFARSILIKDIETGNNFGYIFLPGFYNDFRDTNGRKSSEDVKKEITSLKKKNIDGLILDLRGNGGGALNDAVSLSGLFIKKGPILQTKNRQTGIRVLNDPDPEIHYDGPLIVLVNSLSASASEIVAAALQDYNRAIIVGGAHSFGKGTVQMLIDLDRFITRKSDDMDSLGAFKVTIQKFYRINGTSNQYTGVVPDIVLPDHYDHLKIGEKYYNHPLKSDTIKALEFTDWNYGGMNIGRIKQLSAERVAASKGFRNIEKYITKLNEMRLDRKYRLKIDHMAEEQKKLDEEETDRTEKDEKYLQNFSIVSSLADQSFKSQRMKKIAEENEKNWFEQLEKDIQLNESLMILIDMAHQLKDRQ